MGSDGDRTMIGGAKVMTEMDEERMNSSWSWLPNRLKEFLPKELHNCSMEWIFCTYRNQHFSTGHGHLIKVRCKDVEAYYSFYNKDQSVWMLAPYHSNSWVRIYDTALDEIEYGSLMSLMSDHFELFV